MLAAFCFSSFEIFFAFAFACPRPAEGLASSDSSESAEASLEKEALDESPGFCFFASSSALSDSLVADRLRARVRHFLRRFRVSCVLTSSPRLSVEIPTLYSSHPNLGQT